MVAVTAWRRRCRGAPRVVRRAGAGDTPEPTLTASIWDLLNLKPRNDREELRKAYKEFVLKRHPDVQGASADPDFVEKFERVTTKYKEVMEMNDDQFWVAAFDAGTTQVVTGKVNPPSLNPWETKYRNWARSTGQEVKHQLQDDIDVNGPAEFFLSSTETAQPEEAANEGKPVNGHAQTGSPANGQSNRSPPKNGENAADAEESGPSLQVPIFVGGAVLLLGSEVQVITSFLTSSSS